MHLSRWSSVWLHPHRACTGWQSIVAVMIAFAVLSRFSPALATTFVPSGFSQEVIATGLIFPTTFAFLPDGRILIAEKEGVVRIVKNDALLPTPFIDISARVNDYEDRGLLGIAVDPNFTANGYVYLLYTYENDVSQYSGPKTARLTRVTALDDTAAPSSEEVILGTVVGSSCKNFPAGADCLPSDSRTHTVGDMKFATDGSLFVSVGDASLLAVNDDTFRTQDLDSLAGKVLRISTSGQGLASNPFWNGDPSANRSKVWAYGLRNPFRFALQPGSNIPYLGDVGWQTWEEINVVLPGANLGWPCYEGHLRQPGYEPKTICQALYSTETAQAPLLVYPHQVTTQGAGAAVVGGVFYTGSTYPAEYHDAYFYADYAQGWIRYLHVDNNHALIPGSVKDFVAAGADAPVALNIGSDENLYYVELLTGQLRRIRYTAGNTLPTAVASANPPSGLAPLTVQFSSTGSHDPDGDPLHYLWDFGDGMTSITPHPQHTYTTNGIFLVRLTVNDGRGGIDTTTVSILVGNRPPVATINSPSPSFLYKVGDVITYEGSASDPDEGTLVDSALAWRILLFHCPGGSCHTHPLSSNVGKSGSFMVPDHGDDTYLELTLTATDSGGLTSTTSVTIHPRTVQLTLETQPPGLQIVYDGISTVAPLTRTTIVGSVHTLSASSPQGTYVFTSWSDGEARQHNITVGTTDRIYTAVFSQPSSTPVDLTQAGGIIALVTTPLGSGNKNLEVIRDGDKPPVGSIDSLRQYDTWDGKNTATQDWIGYQFSTTQTFTRMVFQEGRHFADGGWFTTLRVQVRQNDVWKEVNGLRVTPAYPGINDMQNYQTYTLEFNPISGEAIRLYGAPGGRWAFISVGELEVFGLRFDSPFPPSLRDLTRIGSIIAFVTTPLGGGNKNLEVIRDGDKPPVGSVDSLRQYDTWDGKNTTTQDWIGYQYPIAQTFSRMIFQEGKHFGDGGWFKNLTVQVRQNGVWRTVAGLQVTPTYPGVNDGQNYQTYRLDFDAIGGDAIRLYGAPGGKWAFVSVGELEIFGPN